MANYAHMHACMCIQKSSYSIAFHSQSLRFVVLVKFKHTTLEEARRQKFNVMSWAFRVTLISCGNSTRLCQSSWTCHPQL